MVVALHTVETVKTADIPGGELTLDRVRVEGGWLYVGHSVVGVVGRVATAVSLTSTFVPDAAKETA